MDQSVVTQKTDIKEKANPKLTQTQPVSISQLKSIEQFIYQLSLLCKGCNLELDNKLAKVRATPLQGEQISEFSQYAGQAEKIILAQHRQMTLQLDRQRIVLGDIVAQLSRVTELPASVSNELKHFTRELEKPSLLVWDLTERLTQLAEMVSDILQQHFDGDTTKLLPKHRQLAAELCSKLAELEFTSAQQPKLTFITQSLEKTQSVEHLLHNYRHVFDLLVENMAREKSASQEFLHALSDTLSAVKQAVTESAQSAVQHQTVKAKLNNEINSSVASIGASVDNSVELNGLKAEIGQQLVLIKTALARKEALEQREQDTLKQALQNMSQELNQVNQEAQRYKHRLVEQQKINELDALTRLPNRGAWDQRLNEAASIAKRDGSPLWLVVADIDHFKQVNDTYGHSSGDKTLQVVAMAIKNTLNQDQYVARFGGEEFALLLPGLSAAEALESLNSIREKVRNIPFRFKSQPVQITLSLGAAAILSNESVEQTFERADACLYRAKQKGRDKVIIDE
ncbi:GGDEF domain-containing protein [Paraferrimonas sedimenticola]|uniref:diguanylate cyclase n=1 Tax=Paraferrimonas sedimenticola TaxID=375674 RepID=A0AA37RU68_9GAMM|nr:GGDEF domain-containing protein [Paraferrimonas sedimenticola]GLP95223.1 diguanylate cyclase [Paraferrimonas sedimenticola]